MSNLQLSHFFSNPLHDGYFKVLGIIDSSTHEEILTFIDHPKFLEKLLSKDNITCILTNHEVYDILPSNHRYGVVICKDPRNTFFQFHNKLSTNKDYVRKQFDTIIGEGCEISELASISKNNVRIGKNVTIEEFVSIKENVVIEDNSIIRAGTIVGGCGFEFKKEGDTQYQVKHLGGVKIGHDSEIQYNCAIDKAVYPWDDTTIGNYTKIDNLIHVGHAAKIGNNVMITALSVIGGRVEIKNNAWIGIGSVIRNGLIIGDNARTNMGAVVTKNVNDNESVTGNFAIEHSKFIKRLKEK